MGSGASRDTNLHSYLLNEAAAEPSMTFSPIPAWREAVDTDDFESVERLLAEDAVFQSPAVHSPQEGKALVVKYLRAAMAVLNNETFRYLGEWTADRSAVLEFEATIGGVYVNGVDMIWWNDDGLITRFKVMVRPMKGLNTLVPIMARQLQGSGE